MKYIIVFISFVVISVILPSCFFKTSCKIKNLDGTYLYDGATFENVHNLNYFKYGDTVVFSITKMKEVEMFCENDTWYSYEVYEKDFPLDEAIEPYSHVTHGNDENHLMTQERKLFKGILEKH